MTKLKKLKLKQDYNKVKTWYKKIDSEKRKIYIEIGKRSGRKGKLILQERKGNYNEKKTKQRGKKK